MKTKPKENNLPETDGRSFQPHMTLKPTCEISSKLNLEIFPDSTLPQKSISASLNSLLLSEDAPCLNTQEQLMSSLRPLAMQQITAVSKSLISESHHSNTLSHKVSAVADLHLSAIDWEGTSFSNSPAISTNAFSHGLKSELETPIPDSFKNTPGQLSCESQWCTTNIKEVFSWDLGKTNSEDHLLSGITDLHLQDLPLKERILRSSSHPQDHVQPDVDLKTISLLTVNESCIANSTSDCLSRISKDRLGISLQNESRNSKVLKEDQLFQEDYKVNTSVPYSVSNMMVKTSVRVRPPNVSLAHSRKVDVKTTQNIVMKKSVCLDRHSSDEESVPVFGKAKNATQQMKQSSQKHKPAQLKKNDTSKLSNPKIHMKETEQYVQAYKTARNEENYSDTAKSSLSFLQCHKENDKSGACLDSPLPLRQRLKLRLQNT